MNIEQALQAKRDLEIALTAAVAEFQDSTGLTTNNIYLTQNEVTGMGDSRAQYVPKITVEVKL